MSAGLYPLTPLQATLPQAVKTVQQQIIETQNQLSSGHVTLNPGENGIITRLSAQAGTYKTVETNIKYAQNVLDVGTTALTSMSSIASQLSNLATQGSSAGLSTADRASMATTFASLFSQFTTLSTAATINGNNIVLTATPLLVKFDPTQGAFSMTGVDTTTSVAAATNAVAVVQGDATTFTQTKATTILTEMSNLLDAFATSQGSISAYAGALRAMLTGAQGIATGLNSTVASIQNVDPTAMQAQLQALNNQQSIDYYLVTQMNTESAGILSIFR